MTRRRILRLQPHDDTLLRTLYREFNITIDKYPLRPTDLARFVQTWNNLSGRDDTAQDILHYMMSKRKNLPKGPGWEKLGRDAGTTFMAETLDFSKEEVMTLDLIYEDFQVASDNYALDAELASRLRDEFARRTKRLVPPMILAAAMIRRRKDGVLATLRPKDEQNDLGFRDIDQVANG
jgi:hypothetical protein